MMDFDRWMRQQAAPAAPAPEPILPDGVREQGGHFVARCTVCEQTYELPCDLDEFDPAFSYCGGSPRCCP